MYNMIGEIIEGVILLLLGVGCLIGAFLMSKRKLKYGGLDRYYGTVTDVNTAGRQITVTYGDGKQTYTAPYDMTVRAQFDSMPEVGTGVAVLAYWNNPEQIHTLLFMKEAGRGLGGSRKYLHNSRLKNMGTTAVLGLVLVLIGAYLILRASGRL